MRLRRLLPLATLAASLTLPGLSAQEDTPPLPDIPTLMHAVEAHQRTDELRQRDYIFREADTLDQTDKHGNPSKRETSTADNFWINGVPVRKQLSKDGKPLSPDDLRKEDGRIDKEVREATERRAKNESKGRQTDPEGNEEVTVSRILELGTFSNPRRVLLNGRSTVVVDYTGDPHARTRNRAEDVIRDLTGTIWVDEQDREIARLEGQFVRSFKIAGGLLANIAQGTRFTAQIAKINNDVWLPSEITASGDARFLLLFSFRGNLHVLYSDFRRFHTTSTLLPGVAKPDPQDTAPPPDTPRQP